ncbi:MAG TPA: DUF554 domain-containing protein [Acidimicrobiales bacterium]|nr:DUF554 domain-containing protein [Acidimicrobiales bacterium]
MRGLGTIINIGTVLVGSSVGVVLGGRFADRVRSGVMAALGLLTIVNGISQAQETHNFVFPLVGLAFGTAIGEAVSLEDRFERLGERIAARVKAQHSHVGEAFVTASLVFCVGPLAILGSLEDGLGRGYELLLVKSGLDGFASLVFASTLGWGVGLSALSVGIYQGALTAAATLIDPILTPRMLTELTATGGVIVMGIGVRLLELRRIRVGSMLPALLLTPVIVGLFAR